MHWSVNPGPEIAAARFARGQAVKQKSSKL